MAFGFIRKVFSFGKKKVEEIPAEGTVPAGQREESREGTPAVAGTAGEAPKRQSGPAERAAGEERAAQDPAGRPHPGETAAGKPARERQGEDKSAQGTAPQTAPREASGEPEAAAGGKPGASLPETPAAQAEAGPGDERTEAGITEKAAMPLARDAATTKVPEAETGRSETAGDIEEAAGETEEAQETGQKEGTAQAVKKAGHGKAGAGERERASEAPADRPVAAEPGTGGQDAPEAAESGAAGTGGETAREAEAESVKKPLSADEDAEKAPSAPRKVQVAAKVEAKTGPEPARAPEPAPATWFRRLTSGLSRSSRELTDNIRNVFAKRRLDEDTLQDLEDVLIQADLGLETAVRITDALSEGRYGKDISDDEVRRIMAAEIETVLCPVALPLELDLSYKPHVILVVGVNGTGKTTTIGKLAAKLAQGGLSVMLAAGDTFRAAAIEQLKIWGERVGAPVISSKLGADAAGLAYDAFEKAREAGSDVLIIDTAGRLQNKAELMDELAKIVRVLGKLDPEAPHTVLQTLDATTGQNALSQVEIFRNVAGVNGLVMTKLDGTARGGILVAIAAKHKLPVYFIGVGEQVDDLEPFSAPDFAAAITGVEHEPADL